ncbi:hypothetical protein BACCOPRO_02306 [Phocaeicola coprophilus DSM 18228 = JCM 13818]|uniref:Uncharacterized protein n=1 Tax=Phocaeicola coprophilus DSM 18228 = JCM 13818 TaxID=547042 RepID=S0F9M8_9BACT|nr:hypothetical protein BACCOPRO_02306 [Phocaeicola coprophilus DSM 18228 = JCM 13818]
MWRLSTPMWCTHEGSHLCAVYTESAFFGDTAGEVRKMEIL